MFDTDVIYYIPASYVNTENGLKSPYGEFTESYVGVTYDGEGYSYYLVSNDTTGQGVVEVTPINELTEDLIVSDIKDENVIESIMSTQIEGKTTIKVLNPETSEWTVSII